MVVTTYNAGPFAPGSRSMRLPRLGLVHVPVGTGNTERLLTAIERLKPASCGHALLCAAPRRMGGGTGHDAADSSIRRILVAGEPGGGEPAMRAQLEAAWGARVTEAMGIGDIAVSLWGECPHQGGMHFSGRGLVHFELIDPESGAPVALEDGAEGELVYTHLRQQAAPLLRFRSRDHVRLSAWAPAPAGARAPRVRCIGRTDDMLIVRGVNVFPSGAARGGGRVRPGCQRRHRVRPPPGRQAGPAAARAGRTGRARRPRGWPSGSPRASASG
jgi:phenylacetate-CoA ligase